MWRRLEIITAWMWNCLVCAYSWWDLQHFLRKLHFRFLSIKDRLSLDTKEKSVLLEWVASKVQKDPPADFTTSWKNGVVLCSLIEGMVPGACPRYDLLMPKNHLENIVVGLELAQKYFNIKAGITAEEILHCAQEEKLIAFIAKLKGAKRNRPPERKSAEECVAKGMGLMVAVRGRRAGFNIFLNTSAQLDIIMEIRGPRNTLRSERITPRSPKKRSALEYNSLSDHRKRVVFEGDQKVEIPFEYEVSLGKISISYIPLATGRHRVSILWRGQHITGSPFIVSVDHESNRTPLRRATSHEGTLNREVKSLHSTGGKRGVVISRRVIKRVMVENGREVAYETTRSVNPIIVIHPISKNKTSFPTKTNMSEEEVNSDLQTDAKRSETAFKASLAKENSVLRWSASTGDAEDTSANDLRCHSSLDDEVFTEPQILSKEDLSSGLCSDDSNCEIKNRENDLRGEEPSVTQRKPDILDTSPFRGRRFCESFHCGITSHESFPQERSSGPDEDTLDNLPKIAFDNSKISDREGKGRDFYRKYLVRLQEAKDLSQELNTSQEKEDLDELRRSFEESRSFWESKQHPPLTFKVTRKTPVKLSQISLSN